MNPAIRAQGSTEDTGSVAIGRDALKRFLVHLELQGSSPYTVRDYRQDVEVFLAFLEAHGHRQIATVERKTVEAYQKYLHEEYRDRQRGRRLRPGSQQKKLCVAREFFRFLYREGAVFMDPTAAIEMPRVPRRLPGGFLTLQEMERLQAQPDLETVLGYRDRTWMEVMYSCALRIGESVSLRIQDVDLPDGYLTVHGKGNFERRVPIGKTAAAFLREYIASVRPRLGRDDAQTLFLNRFGQRFDTSGLMKALQAYVQRAGIAKKVTSHSFRKSCATQMLRGGANTREIQEMLGHRSILSTDLYTQVVKQDLKRVHRKTHPREREREV